MDHALLRKIWILGVLFLITTGVIVFPHRSNEQEMSYIPTKQMILHHTYRVYIEPIPDYAPSYASNVVNNAFSAWEAANPKITFSIVSDPTQDNAEVQWIKDWGSITAGQESGGLLSKKLIQIGLGDSNCQNKWEPYSSDTITHIAEHEIGHFLGFKHSTDPNNIMYPSVVNQYGTVQTSNNLAVRYAWFIPICTTKDITSFNYQVSTSDPEHGPSVYFVPFPTSLEQYNKGQSFEYYSNSGCYGKNQPSYANLCDGVRYTGGLLVIMPEKLTNPLETISVQLTEMPSTSSTTISESSISQSTVISPSTSIHTATTPTQPICFLNGAITDCSLAHSMGHCREANPDIPNSNIFDCSLDQPTPQSTPPTIPYANIFEVQDPNSQQTFGVRYTINGGTIKYMTINSQSLSLIVTISSTSDGSVTLQIPRSLMDSKTNSGQDNAFIILIDGAEVKPQSQASNSKFRIITMPFLVGDSKIEILGTQIIPEFGPASIVFTIAVITTIAVSIRVRSRIT